MIELRRRRSAHSTLRSAPADVHVLPWIGHGAYDKRTEGASWC
jgi:hypothetical protein